MKVLIACEFSGTVRDAFRARGHDAVSADLLPTEAPGPHYQGDARDLLGNGWDLLIAHPPCTRLCNSGVRWLEERGLWDEMREAARLFLDFLNAPISRVAVENPVMHGHAREIIGRGPDFTIQPWQFGDGEIKRTCFWTRGLMPLRPTHFVVGREPRIHRAPPSDDRAKIRSVTYPGIAAAMADQWGSSLSELANCPHSVRSDYDAGPLFDEDDARCASIFSQSSSSEGRSPERASRQSSTSSRRDFRSSKVSISEPPVVDSDEVTTWTNGDQVNVEENTDMLLQENAA